MQLFLPGKAPLRQLRGTLSRQPFYYESGKPLLFFANRPVYEHQIAAFFLRQPQCGGGLLISGANKCFIVSLFSVNYTLGRSISYLRHFTKSAMHLTISFSELCLGK
jgi:hypothetical protein